MGTFFLFELSSSTWHPCKSISKYIRLLALASKNLDYSSAQFKVYQAAILTHHPPVQGHTVFPHSVVTRFLKLTYPFPPVREPPPLWDLIIVLTGSMGLPFEPFVTLLHLLKIDSLPGWHNISQDNRGNAGPPDMSFMCHLSWGQGHPELLYKVLS